MLTKSLVHAGALLALVLSISFLVLGCGGGSGPVNVPVDPDPTPSIPTPDPQTTIEYRVFVIEGWDGGVATNSIECYQGVLTPFEIRYDFRTDAMGGNWSPVAQESTLDITIEGSESGHKMPDIGLTGGQHRIRTGTCRLEFFPPSGGQVGSTYLVLKVRESGAQNRIKITIWPQGDNPCRELHPVKEAIGGYWWDCVGGVWENTGELVNPPLSCRDLHPTKEAINGYWWDCVDNCWVNTGVPIDNPPPPDKNLFPLDANPSGYYSGSGQQSLTLELQPLPSGVGWVNWEIPSGPSGAFTVPLGMPQTQCEFYYTAPGTYVVRATPYESEHSFDTGGAPIGNYATFTVVISAG